jgi:transposase-like protein
MNMRRDVVDDGLAKIGNTYFLVRSPVGGATHTINPKTKKTYCGKDMLKLWDKWRPIDKLPDDKNQPTCKICQRHYDDPIKETLRNLVRELKETIEDYLDTRLILKDAEGLGRFTTTIAAFMRSERKRIKEKKEAQLEVEK